MRIVSRQEFLTLPAGTVYQCYDDEGAWPDEQLCVKGESLTNDWFYTPVELMPSTPRSDSDTRDYLEMAAKTGLDYEVEPFSTRDGMFDATQQFYVYSNDEVMQLCTLLLSGIFDEVEL